jgi:hypothetical protein
LDFSDALDECLKRFILLAFAHVPPGESLHHFGNAFRRNGSHCQAIRACVVSPLASKHNLKVWDGIVPGVTAHAIESQVGDVVLSAGIETTANFDMQVLYRFIQRVALLGQSLTELASQTAGGRNSKFAGIGSGTGGNVDYRSRARLAEAYGFQCSIDLG